MKTKHHQFNEQSGTKLPQAYKRHSLTIERIHIENKNNKTPPVRNVHCLFRPMLKILKQLYDFL